MPQFGFSKEENGYSVSEVDRYISRLQEEYRNAVEWSNEIEKGSVQTEELEKLKSENQQLSTDCHMLAARLRDLMQTSSQTENIKSDAEKIIAGAKARAEEIILEAEKNAALSLEKADEECRTVIDETMKKIEAVRNEVQSLYEKKDSAEKEIRNMFSQKEELLREIESLKSTIETLNSKINEIRDILN